MQVQASLAEMEVAPQLYGIKWTRLLFAREFSMPVSGDNIGGRVCVSVFVSVSVCVRSQLSIGARASEVGARRWEWVYVFICQSIHGNRLPLGRSVLVRTCIMHAPPPLPPPADRPLSLTRTPTQDVLRLWDFMFALHAETGEEEGEREGEEESLQAVVAAVAVAMVGNITPSGTISSSIVVSISKCACLLVCFLFSVCVCGVGG